MIKNILFDMGNVLIRFEPKRYVKNAGLSESDQQLLLRELYGSIDWVRLDRGTLTEAEVIDRCVSRVGEHLRGLVVSLVGVDDARDELVADDVLLGQLDDANALDAAQDGEGLAQSALLSAGQVDLGHIARDDHLCVPSHAGEEHADLLSGGVLCLVKDDYRVAQGATAHEGQGRNLYLVLVHHVLEAHLREHVLQGVVERLEVGVDLVLHVAGEEPEFLACLDGRTREDDFLGCFFLESFYCKCDAEVCFSRSCRSCSKHHIVLLVSIHQLLLVFALTLYGLA